MPKISLCLEGQPVSTPVLEKSGSYYVTALALTYHAREGAICVETGGVGLLHDETNSVLWTENLQSCFTVVFKFRNGDVGLYHAFESSISRLRDLLARKDLVEIQLFEKGTLLNSLKVKAFAENVMQYFADKVNPPAINIKIHASCESYKVALCYKLPNGEPVILIGESGDDGMANDLDKCLNADSITACKFESVYTKFGSDDVIKSPTSSPIDSQSLLLSNHPSFFKSPALASLNFNMDLNAVNKPIAVNVATADLAGKKVLSSGKSKRKSVGNDVGHEEKRLKENLDEQSDVKQSILRP